MPVGHELRRRRLPSAGLTACVAGAVIDDASRTPGARACNGIDDDCDTYIDNGFDVGAACANGAGACQRAGNKVCSLDGSATECNAIPGLPSPETCNGIDDNCDTIVDNAPVPTGFARVSLMRGITLTFVEWLPIPSATGYDLVRGFSSLLSSNRGNYTT